MAKFTATVTIEFDYDDLAELAERFEVPVERIDPYDVLFAELQNLSFGSAWIEQIVKG